MASEDEQVEHSAWAESGQDVLLLVGSFKVREDVLSYALDWEGCLKV